MSDLKDKLSSIMNSNQERLAFWSQFVTQFDCKKVAEVGIRYGNFSARLLTDCKSIETYYMIDPWRHIDNGYNDLANVSDDEFQKIYDEAVAKVEFAKHKVQILRGTTSEVIDQIPDESLDFIYIDGDHTLEGITIDMIKWYPKVKPGGFIGGDDFSPSIFPHTFKSEPVLVFPWVVYFAKAMNEPLFGLSGQFVMQKTVDEEYSFTDLTGGEYEDISIRSKVVRGLWWYLVKAYIKPLYLRVKNLMKAT